MALLSQTDIDAGLESLDGWTQEGDAIVRSVKAASFVAGIDLVRRVADAAEEADHHPDIDIRWTTITFRLSTHAVGGITTRDLKLARKINDLV